LYVKKIYLRGKTKSIPLASPLELFAAALALSVLFLNGGSNLALARSDGDGGTVAKTSASTAAPDAAKSTDAKASSDTASTSKSTDAKASSDTASTSKSTDAKAGSDTEGAGKPDPKAAFTEDQWLRLNEKVKRLEDIIEQQQKVVEALQNQMKGSPAAPAIATAAPASAVVASAAPSNPAQPNPTQPAAAGANPVGTASPATTPVATASASSGGQVEDAPLQFHIGAATIQPLGFVDFTGVFRSTTTGSGIGTNFGSIPFSNTQAGNLTEFRFSPQNSRLGARIDADVHGAHVMGYFETDFLGFVPTNAPVTSNGYTQRVRLAFVDVRKGKVEVLGGQVWSLMTPNRTGAGSITGDVFYTSDMDTNYQVGLTWARQAGFHFIYHPSDTVAFAVGLENPEQYVGGTNGAGTITLPAALAASTIESELDTGATTLATPNVAPDVIAKLAFDPHVGEDHHLHIEFVGLERNFKTYNPLSKETFNAQGGGGAVNLNLELFKGFHLISNNFYGDGGGRYIFGQAPDLVLRADGSPSLIHSFSGVEGIEANVTPKTLLFAYYGGVYIDKNLIVDPATGHFVGYGFPASASSINRTEQEATFGLNQTFWSDPKYGKLSLILQYSYLIRSPWVAPETGPNTASINMAWIDLRYTLPGTSPKY
jgi:hypothetical protein